MGGLKGQLRVSRELVQRARETRCWLSGSGILGYELSGSNVICCSNCRARCCVSVWVVTIWKASEAAVAPLCDVGVAHDGREVLKRGGTEAVAGPRVPRTHAWWRTIARGCFGAGSTLCGGGAEVPAMGPLA